MLSGKQNSGIRRIHAMHPIIFLPLFIAIIIAISACTASKGSIVILENPNGAGFTMEFKEWSSKNKCGLSLSKGDVLQIEVDREYGEIALLISGKNGSEPYMGNNLESAVFTVTVSETDKYDIRITGKNATGKVKVKKLESSAEYRTSRVCHRCVIGTVLLTTFIECQVSRASVKVMSRVSRGRFS